MNNPGIISIDIDDQRNWLNAHKAETGWSWSVYQKKVYDSTALSAFAVGAYRGDNLKIAEAIFRYRQLLVSQAQVEFEAPIAPMFFETPTTRRIVTILSQAQMGRMVVIASGPGTSKSKTVEFYRASVANVWVATMAPSTSGVNTMQIEVLEALGEPMAKGTPQSLSRRIKAKLGGSGGLLVIDEAQHLSEKALEEIRSWHDATAIGIALVGNEDVLLRLETGNRSRSFARLASRIGRRLIFGVATEGDALALADAWNIEDEKCRRFIAEVGARPGSLRNCTMMIDTGFGLAASENDTLKLSHLQDAWSMLSTRQMA